jgi:glycosyltransferase involved in cell wall biosynthesis
MKKKIALVILDYELEQWGGGVSYYKNLINIVSKINRFEFTIFTNSPKFVKINITQKNRNNIIIKEIFFFKKNNFFNFIRKVIIFFLNKDYFLYFLLKKEKIKILSHRKLFINKCIKNIGWIPDLQHKVYKKFFTKKFYNQREKYVKDELTNSNKIFVSSYQVKKEFYKHYNEKNKIIPLRIVSHINNSSIIRREKNFLLFPSQFWIHKNHRFLIDVAKIIKYKKIKLKIIFCGKTYDYRKKDNYNNINKQIQIYKLKNIIKILGEVSYLKLKKLQKDCLAMINPSYYEGWSTINEEARAQNKFIFLSNIPGHIEQKNNFSIFFKLNDKKDFINKLINFLKKRNFINRKKLIIKNKEIIQKFKSEFKKELIKTYENL